MRSVVRSLPAAWLLFEAVLFPPAALSIPAGPAFAEGAQSASAGGPAVSGHLVGRFKLIDQTYEGGQANIAVAETPVHVEFTLEGGRLAGRIWAGGDDSKADSWPAFRSDAGPLAVREISRTEDDGAGAIEVRYTVQPSADDDLVLDVTERYQLSADGNSLAGTMRVSFTGGDTNRGGYTLHRRFERER
jgi:hypothetical protein